ncbi:hypothetical protein OUZ56_033833 [Daphnia magna]|uniref:Uncharacterized protein n=1 Tax=Daphnia magna TaxID=35525 RepID=A0ABQ9ZYB2_9CRUS|nr:hypothetical protein OUZ56_033833 [Daphnia magna]
MAPPLSVSSSDSAKRQRALESRDVNRAIANGSSKGDTLSVFAGCKHPTSEAWQEEITPKRLRDDNEDGSPANVCMLSRSGMSSKFVAGCSMVLTQSQKASRCGLPTSQPLKESRTQMQEWTKSDAPAVLNLAVEAAIEIARAITVMAGRPTSDQAGIGISASIDRRARTRRGSRDKVLSATSQTSWRSSLFFTSLELYYERPLGLEDY